MTGGPVHLTGPSLAAVTASPHLPALAGGVQRRCRSSGACFFDHGSAAGSWQIRTSPSGRARLIWLVVGVLAAYQRHYFANSDTSCAKASTIAATVLSGPLNYAGINRKVKNCKVPQPSR